MLIYALMFNLEFPADPVHWLAILMAIILSWLVSFTWRFLINLTAFWTPNASGIGRFGFVISWFFSGFLMPLRFLPEWTQQLAYFTPFPHMLNTVVEVYLGILTGPALLNALLIQALWSLGLILVAQMILRAAVKRLVILGG